MLKQALAVILLISHVNFSMFIAQVDEADVYDASGQRINDVNSIAEYINDVLLHNQDRTRHDEDDDNARYFHVVKLTNYCFTQPVLILSNPGNRDDKNAFPLLLTTRFLPVFFDVLTPPPKAAV